MLKAPDGLMVNFLQGKKVEAITSLIPEFGWIVHSPHINDVQIEYQILVASSRKNLVQEKADVWDSKQCESEQSINIAFSGKKLESHTSYFWKVRIWSKLGGESEWSKIQEFATGNISTEYHTTHYSLVKTEISPHKIIKKAKRHFFIDFGKVAFGFLKLNVKSPVSDRKIIIHLAERGNSKGVNKRPGGSVRYYKLKQNLKEGWNYIVIRPCKKMHENKQVIKLPNSIGVIGPFRYVEIEKCPVELDSSNLKQVAIHYPFNEDASYFESSNKILNEVWELCKYSIKATSFCGIYIDGDRERMPYEADAYINQLGHYSTDREFTLARYSHEYLLKNPTWPTEWKFHSILMAWADFMYTGNSNSLIENYSLLKLKTLEEFAREDGLLNTKGQRDIVDWPPWERDKFEFKDVNAVVNAFYYKILLIMADIALTLDKKDESDEFRKKAKNVNIKFNEVFFDQSRGVYLDGENASHSSLHSNMIPLAFGLVPQEHRSSVSNYVVSRGMACSVYGAQYLLESLYEGGRSDIALKLMTSKDIRSWYNMLHLGSTITLEAWDNRFKSNQDWNHAWGAVPGNIIPRYLMGIRPIELGFKKVLIQPQPGSLRNATATIPTIRGSVTISFKNHPNHPFELEIDIPVNMVAKVGIPVEKDLKTTIIMNGEKISSKSQNGFLFIDNVGSGHHTFIVN